MPERVTCAVLTWQYWDEVYPTVRKKLIFQAVTTISSRKDDEMGFIENLIDGYTLSLPAFRIIFSQSEV